MSAMLDEQIKLNVVEDDGATLEAAISVANNLVENDTSGMRALLVKCTTFDEADRDVVLRIASKRVHISLKSVRSVFNKLVKSATKDESPGNTHSSYAREMADSFTYVNGAGDYPPIGCRGEMLRYNPDTQTWVGDEHLTREITDKFDGRERCKSAQDYKGVFKTLYLLQEDKDFFNNIPVGLAVPGSFYSVEGGAIRKVPLGPEHRQTTLCPVAPEQMPTPLWDKHLQETFGIWTGEDDERQIDEKLTAEQIHLFQEVGGAIIVRYLHKLQKAALLLGPGRNGKGVLLKVLSAFFPPHEIGNISPFNWHQETSCSSLSKIFINVVGELNKITALPDGAFKNVVGGDMVNCRNLYQMHFYATITASHIFAGQYFPHTRDRTRGFWDRWVIFHAPNIVPEDKRNVNLVEQLVDSEAPGVLHWLLEGAARVVKRGYLEFSTIHHTKMREWQLKHTPILAWIHEDEGIEEDPDATCGRTVAYDRYREWCASTNRKVESATNFYDELERHGYRTTVKHSIGGRKRGERDTRVKGVKGIKINLGRGNEEATL